MTEPYTNFATFSQLIVGIVFPIFGFPRMMISIRIYFSSVRIRKWRLRWIFLRWASSRETMGWNFHKFDHLFDSNPGGGFLLLRAMRFRFFSNSVLWEEVVVLCELPPQQNQDHIKRYKFYSGNEISYQIYRENRVKLPNISKQCPFFRIKRW